MLLKPLVVRDFVDPMRSASREKGELLCGT